MLLLYFKIVFYLIHCIFLWDLFLTQTSINALCIFKLRSFFSFIKVYSIYKKYIHFNVYSLVSLDICIHPWYHQHSHLLNCVPCFLLLFLCGCVKNSWHEFTLLTNFYIFFFKYVFFTFQLQLICNLILVSGVHHSG